MSIEWSRRTVASFAAALSFLAAAGCGTDASAPATPVASAVQATSAVTQVATVGTAVTSVPTVKVVSATGAPVAGTVVTFTVTGGGSLGATSATTNTDGTASSGSWTVGPAAGANTVTANVTGLSPVSFTATGVAGAAASLAVVAGDNQTAAIGTAVSIPPAIAVKDQYGNAVSSATVTFAVDAGAGSLTGASAITGADGVARLGGWTLGIATGAQRLKATSGGISATVSATGIVPAGCTITNYALGATLSLNWDANDCTKSDGRRYDRLQFSTTEQAQIDAAVTGPSGRYLQLMRQDSLFVGLQPGTAFSPPTQNPMHLKYVLAPGTYTFEPIAPDAATTGAYSFATTTNTKIDCDYIVFATPNVTIDGVVDDTSCLGPVNDREQWINLQLRTGMKVRLTLSSPDGVPFLLFRDDRLGPASPTLVTARGTTKGETVSVTWTATFDTWHEIIVTSSDANLLGRYTLKIEQLP